MIPATRPCQFSLLLTIILISISYHQSLYYFFLFIFFFNLRQPFDILRRTVKSSVKAGDGPCTHFGQFHEIKNKLQLEGEREERR